jgi:hypothetical protein
VFEQFRGPFVAQLGRLADQQRGDALIREHPTAD